MKHYTQFNQEQRYHISGLSKSDWNQTQAMRADLSPDQVSNRLELEIGLQISPEIIYLHIYADKRNGGELHQHLCSQKPRRKRYARGQERRGTIRNRISIEERPDIVVQKTRIGDWEGDTVIGNYTKQPLAVAL